MHIEHRPFKPLVPGSSPGQPTISPNSTDGRGLHTGRELRLVGGSGLKLATPVLEPFALAALGELFFNARPIEIDDEASRNQSDGFDGKEFSQADWNGLAHACGGLYSSLGRRASPKI